jgi:hypothetical protein
MPTKLAEGQGYAGRRKDVAVVNCSMPKDAATLLRQYAGGKTLGRFMARLVYEYDARQQERQRLREEMSTVFEK